MTNKESQIERVNMLEQKNRELMAHIERLRYVMKWVMPYANDYNSNASGHGAAYQAAEAVLEETPAQSLRHVESRVEGLGGVVD